MHYKKEKKGTQQNLLVEQGYFEEYDYYNATYSKFLVLN